MQKLVSALVLAALLSGASTAAVAQEASAWGGRNPGAPRARSVSAPPAAPTPPAAAPAPRPPMLREQLEGAPHGAVPSPERPRPGDRWGAGTARRDRADQAAGPRDQERLGRAPGADSVEGGGVQLRERPAREAAQRAPDRSAPAQTHRERDWRGEARQGDGRWRDPAPGRDSGGWKREDLPRAHGWQGSERYQVGRFQRPPGWSARAWRRDQYVPRHWLGLGYLYVEPWDFALPPGPPRSAWMRLGEDAVLVDLRSGRILQVAPALFW